MVQQTSRRPGSLRIRWLTEPAAINALASPVRQELFDTIEALGGVATIAELAEQLGRPADGLYYHVEQLARAGLLAAAPVGTSRAGRSERRYRITGPAGHRVSLGYRPREPRNAAAVRRAIGAMLRIAQRDFDRGLDGDPVVEGPRRELWASRNTGWVNDADLAELNRLLGRALQLLRRPRTADRRTLMSLCFVIAPVAARPRRRAAARPRRSPAAGRRF